MRKRPIEEILNRYVGMFGEAGPNELEVFEEETWGAREGSSEGDPHV